MRDHIIVATMGRCGTNLLYDSVVASGHGSGGFILRFDTIRPKLIRNPKLASAYMTHDYPPDRLPPNVKLIYLFGDPRDIAVSAYKQINRWGKGHHSHLKMVSRFRPNDQVLMEDSLGLHEHFAAWMTKQSFPFASVRYEALERQSVREQLAAWLGFMPTFPEWKQRTSCWREHPRGDEVDSTHKELAGIVRNAEDFHVWGGRKC